MDHIFSTNAWLTIALVFIITLAAKVVRSSVTLPAEKTSKPRPPPEAKGAPLVGIIPAVLRRGLQAVIREQHRALGSVFTLRSLGLAVTFLVGPECSDHFFHAPEWEIAIDGLYEVTVPIFGKEVGYDIDLDTRNEQHRFFAKMLRPAKLRGHVLPMVCEIEEYFGKWGECGVVDLMQEVDHVLMLIASRCLLGKEVRENMFDEVASLFHELMGGMHLISMFFPYLPTPGHRRRDKARAKLGEIFSQIVKTRKMSGRVEDDMLQDLIDSTYGDGRATTDTEVTGLLVALLFAGHHTSSTVAVWTALRLLTHPEHLRAVRAEQERLVAAAEQQRSHHGGGGGGGIDYGMLLQMDVLHRCIKEALRLHPVTPMILRRARRGFTVRDKEGGEYSVPAGRLLASPLVVNTLLPNIYKDPHVFDPDRFAAGRAEDKAVAGARDLAYLSFGAGKHACMGEGYAYQQIKVILSHLVSNFELKLESPFPETEDMLSMRPKGKVIVSYKRRTLS
ncbi:obtusifoliol 14-alpha demethylase-like [Oryza glaberrima]|uniref:Obtusifoliol 14-alpha demethylase n=1 Tax=Oryza glaberrima TaxID=4538 RepID=I1NZV8_ORYGL|nr:obtusifoliol 14-alpha demethylase-like [Oryza glaberrima]